MTAISPRKPGESQGEYARRKARLLGIKPSAEKVGHFEARPEIEYDDDLIPDVDLGGSPERMEMDSVLAAVDIVEAYERWCGKMQPVVGKRTESIMVSCPNPAHPDANPSAWLTLNKGDGGVGNCVQCGGFDKYQIAAWKFGYPVPGYQSKEDFPALLQEMAEDLGFSVVTSGKETWLEEPQLPAENASAAVQNASEAEETVGVDDDDGSGTSSLPIPTVSEKFVTPNDEMTEEDVLRNIANSHFDWRDNPAIDEGSFMHEWMTLTSTSYEPEEFYFWHGMLALSAAIGNRVRLNETRQVRPNLMVCIVGSTGTGKTISMNNLSRLLDQSFPFDASTGKGVRTIPAVGSGEFLIDQFDLKVVDPNTGETVSKPVNGIYREDELASLAAKTGRAGSTLRESLMSMFDNSKPVETGSRTNGMASARDHYFQMITSTQPQSINTLLHQSDASAGYLNRWVYPFGQPKQAPAISVGAPLDMDEASHLLMNVRSWVSQQENIDWSADAAEIYTKFYKSKIEPVLHEEDAWMLSRIGLLSKKMMMLFAANSHEHLIQPRHVEGFIALWDYLLACYGTVDYQVAQGANTLDPCIDAINQYLLGKTATWVTFRMIQKQSGARKFPKEIVKKAIDLMISIGDIESRMVKGQDRAMKYRFIGEESPVPQMATVTSIK